MAWTCTTHPLLVQPKCCIPAGIRENEPAVNSCAAVSSNFAPCPILNDPEITVTCSAPGWVCGGILNPAGNCRRMVNRPSFLGSPFKMAILAPAGNDGGPSLHFRSPGVNLTCSALAVA